MAGSELTRAARWIYATLTGDSALVALLGGAKVYSREVPPQAVMPYVEYHVAAPFRDVRANNLARIWTAGLMLVQVIGETESTLDLEVIYDRVDTLLDKASGTANGHTILTCFREEHLDTADIQLGKQYRQLGGLYRLLVQ